MSAVLPPAVGLPPPPDPSDPQAFVEDLVRRRGERLERLVQLYPRNQPIASDIDPSSCLRRQVLEVVRWQDKAPIEAARQGRLQAGDDAERRGIEELREMGYRIVKEQVPFELTDRQTNDPVLRGRIDLFLEVTRRLEVPVEVKSLMPFIYDAIDDVEGLMRWWWTAKHFYQMQAYLIGYAKPWGVLWITNLAGDWKPIIIRLDYDVAERVWSFAEKIVAAARTARRIPTDLPPFTQDAGQCTRCPFFGRACNPPIHEQGATVIEDPDLELALMRRDELVESHREYERLDKRVKERFKAGPPLQLCGEFVVQLVPGSRKEQAREARTIPTTTVKIERAGQAPKEA